jgi:hypothetical protein
LGQPFDPANTLQFVEVYVGPFSNRTGTNTGNGVHPAALAEVPASNPS